MQHSDSCIVAPQLTMKHFPPVALSVEDQEQLVQYCVLTSEMVVLVADSWRSNLWLEPCLKNGVS